MDYLLKYEIATICIVHIIAIIISIIAFMIFYMKVNRDQSLKAFLVMQISMILWMVFKIFKTVAPTENLRWSFIVGYYACACILEISFLEFSYAYYKGNRIPKMVRKFIYILPIMQFLFVLTNPYHYLFYSSYDFWGDKFGPLFYVHMVLEYGFIIVGTVFCSFMFNKQFKSKNSLSKYLISAAIIIPLIMNLLYVSKVMHRFLFSLEMFVIFDITPIVFTWSTILFVYATFRHDFFNISPIMRHEIIHKLDTPIGVLNSTFDVIYINKKLKSTIGDNPYEKLNEIIKQYEIVSKLNNKEHEEEVIINNLHLLISIKTIPSIKETQHVLTARDITPYRSVEAELIEKQSDLVEANERLKNTIETLKETSKVGARNYIARELHDIIGHSLVVTIKLLEVSKLYQNKDRKMSIDALNNAINSIDIGVSDMKSISEKDSMKSSYNGGLLKKDLIKMLDYVRSVGMKTNFKFKGEFHKIDEKIFDISKKVCTELVTNALKHSNANEILVSVCIKNSSIDIMIIDDGIGCKELKKGNGLNGIEQRINLVGGSVYFNTSKSEGFMSKIIIPQI